MLNRLHNLAPLLALALVAAMGARSLLRPGPENAEPYHARIAAAVEQVPLTVGPWIGTPVEAPPEATKLLNPNVLETIQYEHAQTGEQATFLLVQCKDAGDLAGHYPPRCYPAHGWQQEYAQPRTWTVDGITFPGIEYRFSYRRPAGTERMIVANFMIMPDGTILRNIDGVYAAAADYTSRFYGAAQVQVVTAAGTSRQRRDEILQQLVRANLPAIEAIRAGFSETEEKVTR